MDDGGYLDMLIPTIKRNNLSGYEKIPMCKSCSCENSRSPHYQLQRYRVLIHLKIHGAGEGYDERNCMHRNIL